MFGDQEVYKAGSQKNKIENKAIGNKVDDKTGAKGTSISPPSNSGRRERSKQARIVWGEGRGGNVCPRTAGQLFRGDRSWGKGFFKVKMKVPEEDFLIQ